SPFLRDPPVTVFPYTTLFRSSQDRLVAAVASINPARWQALFDEMTGRIAGRFSRVEPRRRAEKLMLGLVSELPRKNCWTIAEHRSEEHTSELQSRSDLVCRLL